MSTPDKVARSYTTPGTLWSLLRNLWHTTGVGKLLPQELTPLTDMPAIAAGHRIVAGLPMHHGTVVSAAAMLALHTADQDPLAVLAPRYVKPGDTCRRSDLGGTLMLCLSDNGQAAVDWSPIITALGSYQPADEDLAAIAALATTAFGRSLLTLTGAAALLSAAGAQAALANATALARLTATPGNPPLWDGAAWPGSGGGAGLTFTPGPIFLGPGTYWCAAPGDTQGLIYALGVAAGGGSWTNPHTAGAITVVISDGWAGGGAPAHMVDRTENYIYGSQLGSFAGVDMGAASTFRPAAYTLRNSTQASYALRNFVFEGSNNVTENTAAGFNAATWAAIDVRSDDTTMSPTGSSWALYTHPIPATTYRWLRWRNTGVDSSGGNYFMLSEVELYDTAAIVAPAPYTGWASDGAGHYVPYFAG